MFQSIQPDEIFDLGKAQASEEHPSYWLAQLRKADWLYLLKFVDMKLPTKTRKQTMAEVALRYFEFVSCDGRGAESDWCHGLPEFVHLEKNEPLGFVNIAGRLFCKVK